MPDPQKISSLQSLVSGESLPDFPRVTDGWDLKTYQREIETYHKKLTDYLRRLMSRFTGQNIYNELIEQIEAFAELIAASGSGGGFGPLKLDLFTDCTWVDASSAFNGVQYGSIKVPATYLDKLDYSLAIGQNSSGGGSIKAVRLSGKFVPAFTEDYYFKLTHDDGGRLYIDGNLEIDAWGGNGDDIIAAPIAMTADVPVSFVAEVINNAGTDFRLGLMWNSTNETGGNYRDIPYSQLLAP